MKKIIITVLILAAAGLAYLYLRPVPKVSAVSAAPALPKTRPAILPWPGRGQAAIGAMGYGVLDSYGAQTPVPIASITKIITAYAVLSQRPLSPGQQGPTITLDNTDLGYFNYYYTQGGSDTNVAVGEKISEYQALEAMLLPSSNNMADSLARWAFGSIPDYVAYANQMIKGMGLSHTTVGSSSGFSDKTFSTASDLVKLGEAALKSPVIAGIVSRQTATIPVEGTINNVNALLGTYGVNGIKTGNTDKAGGCYLFSSIQTIKGKPVDLVGAILDQADLGDAIKAAPPLINAASGDFEQVTVVHAGQTLGYYKAPWGAVAAFASAKDLSLLAWRGAHLQVVSLPYSIQTAKAGSRVGQVIIAGLPASSPLILNQNLPGPSVWWRLTHR